MKFGGRHLSITAAKTGTFGVRLGTSQAFGTHTPAMLAETIRSVIAADPGGVYVDGTFGRGGHTRGILAALSADGRLHAFDMDPEVRPAYFSPSTRPFPLYTIWNDGVERNEIVTKRDGTEPPITSERLRVSPDVAIIFRF